MGDTLSEEEVQIISYYLDLTAGEGDDDEEGSRNERVDNPFTQKTQLQVNTFS